MKRLPEIITCSAIARWVFERPLRGFLFASALFPEEAERTVVKHQIMWPRLQARREGGQARVGMHPQAAMRLLERRACSL